MGSTRLASRLLFCITSITPRARYFSFIPWCIYDWQTREKGNPFAYGLRNAITLREKALTLSCIAHHNGHPCDGGALVGSAKARRWFEKGEEIADLARLNFSKGPALGAYFNSLVNLGVFVTETDQAEDNDEERPDTEITFDEIELSPLGKTLAESYGKRIGNLTATLALSGPSRTVALADLRQLGKRGGLCELKERASPDRQWLRDLFFAKNFDKNSSHWMRRNSLLLIMEVCRQLNEGDWHFNADSFAEVAYFGHISSVEGAPYPVALPSSLDDIALRWRQFYFHHYMSVALEGMFSWAVTQASQFGITGTSIDSLAKQLNTKSLQKNFNEDLSIDLPDRLGFLTPRDLLAGYVTLDALNAESSKLLDRRIDSSEEIAEPTLEKMIRERKHFLSPMGLALPLVLLITSLARFKRWEDTPYGKWLANASNDPYLDLVPPVLTIGLERRFANWWNTPLEEIARLILSRYVAQHHQAIAYEKTDAGDRCIIQMDGQRIMSESPYEKIGMGNPRLDSAIQILKDLNLLAADPDNGGTVLSEEGSILLAAATGEVIAS